MRHGGGQLACRSGVLSSRMGKSDHRKLLGYAWLRAHPTRQLMAGDGIGAQTLIY